MVYNRSKNNMKKGRLLLMALAALACVCMTSCFKGERCTCNGVDLGYVDDCAEACWNYSGYGK